MLITHFVGSLGTECSIKNIDYMTLKTKESEFNLEIMALNYSTSHKTVLSGQLRIVCVWREAAKLNSSPCSDTGVIPVAKSRYGKS